MSGFILVNTIMSAKTDAAPILNTAAIPPEANAEKLNSTMDTTPHAAAAISPVAAGLSPPKAKETYLLWLKRRSIFDII